MPDFIRLPDGSLILRGEAPKPKGKLDSLKAAIAGFMDAMRPAPKQDKWWIEQPRVVQPAPQSSIVLPNVVQSAPAQAAPTAAPGLPAYNPWSEIEGKAQDRERIVQQLGEFPRRMMASPLVEGRLF